VKIADSFRWNIIHALAAPFLRRKLKNPNFSIIGNDCNVQSLYHRFGLKYSTPTIGLFIFSDEYPHFLENLKYYLGLSLVFVDESKHKCANRHRREIGYYPIAALDDVEVHFLHYRNEVEVQEKWTRRKARVNYKNLFLLFCESDEEPFKEEYLSRYLRLPYLKLFFSKGHRDLSPEVVHLGGDGYWLGDIRVWLRLAERCVDFVRWLNRESDFRRETLCGKLENSHARP
jgi:uncharacterized protein (DUF1919 family)